MNNAPSPINLIGIGGSLRAGSFNRSLLRLLQRVLPDGTTLDIADISDIPLYNLDVEQADGFPPPVVRLREQIAAADGIVIATPEYNFSIPGVLKNAIDWTSRHGDSPLNHKPTAMAGVAGGSGSRRAQNHLRIVLGHNRMRVMARPEMFVAGGSKHFENGEPISPAFVDQVTDWAAAFCEFIDRMRDVPIAEPGTILIVGRDHDGLRLAADRLAEYGMRSIETLFDAEARSAVEQRGIAALVVLDDVEAEPRAQLEAALAEHRPDSPLVAVSDPDTAGAAVFTALGLG